MVSSSTNHRIDDSSDSKNENDHDNNNNKKSGRLKSIDETMRRKPKRPRGWVRPCGSSHQVCSFWKIALLFLVMYGSLVWKIAWFDLSQYVPVQEENYPMAVVATAGNGTTTSLLPPPFPSLKGIKNRPKIRLRKQTGKRQKQQKDPTNQQPTDDVAEAVEPPSQQQQQSPQDKVFSLGLSAFSQQIQDTWSSSWHSLPFSSSSSSSSRSSAATKQKSDTISILGGTVESWYEKKLAEMERKLNDAMTKNNPKGGETPNQAPQQALGRHTPLVSCRRLRTLLPKDGTGEPDAAATLTVTQAGKTRRTEKSPFFYSNDPIANCLPEGGGGGNHDDVSRSSDSSGGPFYYYNPHPSQERIVCGKSIPPKQFIIFDQLCPEPVTGRLFPTIPKPPGGGSAGGGGGKLDLPPIVARFSTSSRTEPSKPFMDCDVACRTVGTFSIDTKRYIDGTNWVIIMSMEGPLYYSHLEVDPKAWKKNKFYSTTSFQSEIPLPYYSDAEYKIWTAVPVDFDRAIHGGVFMANNCESRNNREKVIQDLQRLANDRLRIESVSSCVHNAEIPPGSFRTDKKSVMNKYLFYFAFENQCYSDYITEKLWGPMEAGTLPVYFGAPNVLEHVPKHSIIHIDEFADTPSLFRYLEQVASNHTLYDSYHAWRQLPQPDFDRKMNLTFTHGTCRTCRWAYARLYGLGWNHEQQRVEDLRIPRQTCVDTQTGLLQHPVEESWSLLSSSFSKRNAASFTIQAKRTRTTTPPFRLSQEATTNCLEGTLTQDEVTLTRVTSKTSTGQDDDSKDKLVRIVRQVDGVIDMEVHALLNENENNMVSSLSWLAEVQWQLTTKLARNASFFQIQPGHVRLQDAMSRVTILTWPRTVKVFAHENILTLQALVFPLRLRMISEDIDTFHAGADQEENYFGSVMIQDFQQPVEVFHQDPH